MVDEPKYAQEVWKNPVSSTHMNKTGGLEPGRFLVSVVSPTMSVSSIMPEPSGAGARVGGLADPVPSRPKMGIPTLSTVIHTVSRPVNTTGSFSSAPGSSTHSKAKYRLH
jgi:hypothetical protein